MKLSLRVLVLFGLVTGTLTQNGFDLDLSDALDDDVKPTPEKPKDPPKKKDDFSLDLSDAFDDSNPKATVKPPAPVPPRSGGGGGTFDDSVLDDVTGGDYKPDGGKSGGRAVDPGHDPQGGPGGPDQPQGDPDLWAHILKNMPEEFYEWLWKLKHTLSPLLERLMDLLQALP